MWASCSSISSPYYLLDGHNFLSSNFDRGPSTHSILASVSESESKFDSLPPPFSLHPPPAPFLSPLFLSSPSPPFLKSHLTRLPFLSAKWADKEVAFFPVQAKVSIMDKEAWEGILRRVRRSAGLVKRRTIAVLRRRRRECQRVHIFIAFLIIYWA